MIDRLNKVPERIQLLILLIPTAVLASWLVLRVAFPPSEYTSPCPDGLVETVVSRTLMCVEEEVRDKLDQQAVEDLLKDITADPDAFGSPLPVRDAD